MDEIVNNAIIDAKNYALTFLSKGPPAAEGEFTQNMVSRCRDKFPNKHVMICHGNHWQNFANAHHTTASLMYKTRLH